MRLTPDVLEKAADPPVLPPQRKRNGGFPEALSSAPASVVEPGELAAKLILSQVGEDPTREGLLDTPRRFSKALKEICSGYTKTVEEVVGNGVFSAEGQGLVCVDRIEFFSLCEHHMLPFWGHASVAYYPDQKILGLSKVARIVELFSRRLQVQERLTKQVAEAIAEAIAPRAVAVRVRAAHTCMMMRGVQKQASETVTEFFDKIDSLPAFERERLLEAISR